MANYRDGSWKRVLSGVAAGALYTWGMQLILVSSDKVVKYLFLPVHFILGSIAVWSVNGVGERLPDGRPGRRRAVRAGDLVETDGEVEHDELYGRRMAARQEQEQRERIESEEVVKGFLGPGTVIQHLPDLGSRLQKRWYSAGQIVTTPMAPRDFVYDAEMLTNMNRVLQGLKHPHVLPVLSVAFRDVSSKFLVVTQWQQSYSLRDHLFGKCDPLLEWETKYSVEGDVALPSNEVAFCGRQILEAMAYLYSQGFAELGCVHTGNIFVHEEKFPFASVEEEEEMEQEKEEEEEEEAFKQAVSGVEVGEGDSTRKVKVDMTVDQREEEEEAREMDPMKDVSSVAGSKGAEGGTEGGDVVAIERGTEKHTGVKVEEEISDSHVEGSPDEGGIRAEDRGIGRSFEKTPVKADIGGDRITDNGGGINKSVGGFGGSVGGIVAIEEAAAEDIERSEDEVEEKREEDYLDAGEEAVLTGDSEVAKSGLVRDGTRASTGKMGVVMGRAKEALSDVRSKASKATSVLSKRGRRVGRQVGRQAGKAVKWVRDRRKVTEETGLEEVELVQGEVVSGCLFCRLGGYENILLGYKTNRYQGMASEGVLDRMDLIMFGHVIYEMATGMPLADSVVFPSEHNYENIDDEEMREDLQAIFNMRLDKRGYLGAIEEILHLKMFNSVDLPAFPHMTEEPLSNSLRQKLAAVLKKRNLKKPSCN